MKKWLITILGGYDSIDSALDAIRNKEKEERRRILTLAVRRLYNTIGSDDILKINEQGQWSAEGKVISNNKREALIAQAAQFTESELWDVLQKDIRYQANRKMYILSTSVDDLVAGKLWLLTLDAITTRLKEIAIKGKKVV